ncbi:Endonuclease/exonuclease/phosphatase, partial [Lenzites betulinus]
LATLNVNGFGRATSGPTSDKWLTINQLVKERRLAVLAVQEAHLTPSRLKTLNELFGDRLAFYASPDPVNPLGAGGVAFVTNKRCLATAGAPTVMCELIPGRAAVLTVPWTATRTLSLLNVYAPNRPGDNAAFWAAVDRELSERHIRPMVCLGDFNFVESPADRMPSRPDPAASVAAFTTLRERLGLTNSWRMAHPDAREYTYCQAASGSQSRLDRVYISRALRHAAADWAIGPAGVVTDHSMASVSLANYQTPEVGRGRWTLPLGLLDDPPFVGTMRSLGMRLQNDLNDLRERTPTHNPQTLFAAFKVKLRNAARERHKTKAAAQDRKI